VAKPQITSALLAIALPKGAEKITIGGTSPVSMPLINIIHSTVQGTLMKGNAHYN